MGKIVTPLVCLSLVVTGGCAGPPLNLPEGEQAYSRIPAVSETAPRPDYVIGPLDRLGITVFGERDLSTDQGQVDAVGNISLPLAGRLVAAGKTANTLATDIRQRLTKYLVNPQVSILVLSSVSQRVIVEGDVIEPGVYPLPGPTTLLEAIALARGPSNVSNEHRVAIFRTINGQRMGAMFDVAQIQTGEMPDPQLHTGDTIIVGHSPRRAAFHDFLTLAPALGLFVAVSNRF